MRTFVLINHELVSSALIRSIAPFQKRDSTMGLMYYLKYELITEEEILVRYHSEAMRNKAFEALMWD